MEHIDFDNKRTNVDSSKKIAVMQHMEYEQFRQMVLGANLKPSKTAKYYEIYQPKNTEDVINSTASYAKIAHGDLEHKEFDSDLLKQILELQNSEQLNPPENSGVFDKFFSKKLKKPFQKYMYCRLFEIDHYKRIFKDEFDAELFVAMVDVFNVIAVDTQEYANPEEHNFTGRLIEHIAKTPSFDFILDFMQDDEKDKIRHLLKGLAHADQELKNSLETLFASLN